MSEGPTPDDLETIKEISRRITHTDVGNASSEEVARVVKKQKEEVLQKDLVNSPGLHPETGKPVLYD